MDNTFFIFCLKILILSNVYLDYLFHILPEDTMFSLSWMQIPKAYLFLVLPEDTVYDHVGKEHRPFALDVIEVFNLPGFIVSVALFLYRRFEAVTKKPLKTVMT